MAHGRQKKEAKKRKIRNAKQKKYRRCLMAQIKIYTEEESIQAWEDFQKRQNRVMGEAVSRLEKDKEKGIGEIIDKRLSFLQMLETTTDSLLRMAWLAETKTFDEEIVQDYVRLIDESGRFSLQEVYKSFCELYPSVRDQLAGIR